MKTTVAVKITSLEDVKEFVKRAVEIDGEVTVISISEKGTKYVVDGKSILGLLSLDLTHPVKVTCEKETDLRRLNLTQVSDSVFEL